MKRVLERYLKFIFLTFVFILTTNAQANSAEQSNQKLIDLSSNEAAAGSCNAFLVNTIGRQYGSVVVDTRRASDGLNRTKLYSRSYQYYTGFTSANNRLANRNLTKKLVSKALSDCSRLGFY